MLSKISIGKRTATEPLNAIVTDFDDTLRGPYGIDHDALCLLAEAKQRGIITGILSGNGLEKILAMLSPAQDAFSFVAAGNGAVGVVQGMRYSRVTPQQHLELAAFEAEMQQLGYETISTGASVGVLGKQPETELFVAQAIMGTSLLPCAFSKGYSAVTMDKATGIDVLEEFVGPLKPLVIGDDVNDLPMMEAAVVRGGRGAVVGNSAFDNEHVSYRARLPYGKGVAEIVLGVDLAVP